MQCGDLPRPSKASKDLPGNIGDARSLASDLVGDSVRLAVGGIDGANKHIVRDVVKVTSVLEPRPAYRNVHVQD